LTLPVSARTARMTAASGSMCRGMGTLCHNVGIRVNTLMPTA
jgi:hypothetical protein